MGKGAVVLELNSCKVTLLTDDGVFLNVPVRRLPGARYIGQHIDLADLKSPHYSRWLTVAAACLIFLLVIPLFRPTPAQAWVTVDGSSSLEVLLDYRMNVIDARALNHGGQQFLDRYLKEQLSFSTFMDEYYEWSNQAGDSTVLVTATASIKAVNRVIKKSAPDLLNLVVLEVNPNARAEADKLGVSTGRALLIAGASFQGVNITAEQIREGNPFSALTEAGVNVEQAVISTSDTSTQVEKIKDLPKSDHGKPGDTANNPNPGPGSDNNPGPSEPAKPGADTPPGQSGKDAPPGQVKKDPPTDPPPGQSGENPPDSNLPQGQGNPGTSPGQPNQGTPPGEGNANTPPGLVNPPGQSNSNGPPDQANKDNSPGQSSNLPPGLAKNAANAPPFGLKEKFKPAETAQSWKQEKTGPPFKTSSTPGNSGNAKGNSSGNNGNAKGNSSQGKGKKP